ncbi:NADP-dependent mannitol dehydrogenase [Ascodesmis nigricans]|uniref:NADP-dependent mannitol dehydrogenase n=1 Tax=Ascodesmis nigricans TaxID=341454 RepID=A0A4S2MUY0_9PEZI|nr:NADP-dependent mannitol dehydrogenase [Ascodesmis nigricans]
MSTLFSLAKRTIIITGGGRGVGLTLAHAITEFGGRAACLDIHPMATGDLPANATYSVCDVTNEESVKARFAEIRAESERCGSRVEGVVACAGIQQVTEALEYGVRDWRRMMEVNVLGAFLTAKHGAKILIDGETPGSVVLVASMSGRIANRGLNCSAYNTSKAAVLQMGRSLAQEWGKYGIRVNTLSPGYIRTNMTDTVLYENPDYYKTWMAGAMLGRLGVVDDFKGPAVYLLSDASRWMTGADLLVDGGHVASA